MADPRNPHFVSSYHALQAAKLAARQAQRKSTAPAKAPGEGPVAPGLGEMPAGGKPGMVVPAARIGRTALPTRAEIVCLHCGGAQEIVGKTTQTVCPKCRGRLTLTDHKIEGEWTGEIVTSGNVIVTAAGVVKGGTITANNITVEGRVEDAHLRASRLFTLREGCAVPPDRFRALDLQVDEGVEYEFPGDETEFRHVEIFGILDARLYLSGRLRVHPGALFSGAVHGPRLEVLEGGGLFADLHIEPPAPRPPGTPAAPGSGDRKPKP